MEALILLAAIGLSTDSEYVEAPKVLFVEEITEQPNDGFGGNFRTVTGRSIQIFERGWKQRWQLAREHFVREFPEIKQEGKYFKFTVKEPTWQAGSKAIPGYRTYDKTFSYKTKYATFKSTLIKLRAASEP